MGWVVDPGDVDSMIAVVEEAVLRPEQLAVMCENARGALETKYTRECVVQRFAELFDGMNQ